MWAISITDFIQSIIIIIGLAVLAFILADKAGGFMTVLNSVPQENLKFFPKPEWKEVTTYLAAWSVLGLGSIPSQDVFQRTMSSNSATTAVRSCYIAALLYLTVAMLPLFISLCTKHLYPAQISGDHQLTLPNMVLAHTELPIQILFFGSLLSAIMSTTSSAILAPAAIFSENLLKPLAKNKFSDGQLLLFTRLSVLLFASVATVMACMRSNIYELVGESSVFSLVSLFAPLMLGLYWKKSSSYGAIFSMFAGLLGWLFFRVYEISVPALVPATLISVGSLVVVSLIYPDKK
jgi:Na+/proline symporter